MLRRILGILIVLLLMLGMAGFGVWRYLKSAPVKDKVVAHFKTIYKGEIKLGSIDVGLNKMSLNELSFFELDSSEKTPWLEIPRLHTDLSALDYFQGNALPTSVKVSGARVLLRFASDGTLLTTLPEPLTRASWENAEETGRFAAIPVIEFENSQITLRTEGSDDVVLQRFSGKLDRNADQLTFVGEAANGAWGKWTIAGLLHSQSAKISVQFKSEGSVHVTQAMLEKLPFVPQACWHELRISQMDTPVLVHVDYDLKQGETHCRAELDPVRARFRVPSLQMQMAGASARIVFEDNQMLVRDLQGQTFSGIVRGGANFTFATDAVRIGGQLEASRLEVSQLPASWGLSQLSGKLSGIATLKVLITPSDISAPNVTGVVALVGAPYPADVSAALLCLSFEKTVHTEGSGRGQIVDAAAGRAHVNSIGIEFHAVPGGFRLGNSPPAPGGK